MTSQDNELRDRIERQLCMFFDEGYDGHLVDAAQAIIDGLVVDHICFNRSCVNPDHLQLLTRGENASRTLSKTLPYCKNMHIRTAENTHHYTDSKGEAKRRCRDCASERAREAYHRRKNIE